MPAGFSTTPPSRVHVHRRHLSLVAYVRRRNGLPLGATGSLRAMLRRAFGAPTLAGFWRHWNPIFGYGLSRFVYTPLRRRLALEPALFTTFVVCGTLHDAVTMLVRGNEVFLFTPWFSAIAAAILLAERFSLSLHALTIGGRALIHTAVLASTFGIGRLIELWLLGI